MENLLTYFLFVKNVKTFTLTMHVKTL